MSFVCKTLDQTTNSCLEWVENQSTQFFPKLTLAEGNAIGFACLLVFATVFVINKIKRAI